MFILKINTVKQGAQIVMLDAESPRQNKNFS